MYQNAQTQPEAGRAYFAGMQWRGIELNGSDAAALNQYDPISPKPVPQKREPGLSRIKRSTWR